LKLVARTPVLDLAVGLEPVQIRIPHFENSHFETLDKQLFFKGFLKDLWFAEIKTKKTDEASWRKIQATL
jgi:hypothetical protein